MMWLDTYTFEHGYAGSLSQEVVEEMFDGLTAVHQCGILHGDIRHSNILIV